MNRHVLALLGVTLVWGATFPVLKLAAQQLSGVEISALRFVVAAACMLPWALRASRRAWWDGAQLGALVLVSYVAQAYGLQVISSNRSAFLTSLNVLMVPVLGVAFGNRLSWTMFMAALGACLGIGLMSWEGGADLWADAATILGALAYALYVILLSQRAGRHDARSFAATQIVWMALLGVAWMLWMAQGQTSLHTLPQRLDSAVVWGLLYLGVIATACMLFVQAWAQRQVSASKAALIYAMEPVCAAACAWLWLGETLQPLAAVGALVVVVSVIAGEWSSTRQTTSS